MLVHACHSSISNSLKLLACYYVMRLCVPHSHIVTLEMSGRCKDKPIFFLTQIAEKLSFSARN